MATPLPLCYLNGEYQPLAQARVSPLDRAFLFGDAVYEVMPVYGRRPFRFVAHCERLTRSLQELGMEDPYTREQWHEMIERLIEGNAPHHSAENLYVYWQVTRGAEYGRNHAPLPKIDRTVFAFCSPLNLPDRTVLERGIRCVTAADNRWGRCDIKSTALLANILLRDQAVQAGASETILLRDGVLTEGSASAVHVVIDGELLSPALSAQVLPSLTRGAVEKMAARARINCRSVTVSEEQLRSASEVLVSAATREVIAVTKIDAMPVGNGEPGPVFRAIHAGLQAYKQELAGEAVVNSDTPPEGAPPPLLQFPTDYPIKVVGRTSDTLRSRIDAIFAAHVPDLDASLTTQRLSGNGNFQSISYTIRAVSAAQVTALATELKACPDVVIVI